MKKVFSKINIFSFILGAVLFSAVSVFAFSFTARDASYSPLDTTWKKEDGENIENVKDALDSLYDSQTNYISQLKKEKVIYITASHKKSTGYNDMGFNVNVYIDDEYFSYSSNKITVKKECDVIINVAMVNTAATTSAPSYKLYKNNSNILTLTSSTVSGDKRFGTINISLEQGDTMYSQMYGGNSNFTYYITAINLDN